MSQFDIGAPWAKEVRCFVCEKAVPIGQGFARAQYGEWTAVFCSRRCAEAFDAQRLPALRRLEVLAVMSTHQWPSPQESLLSEY